MNEGLFAYMHRLELMAFFSGYALLYAFVHFIFGNQQLKNNAWRNVISLLPFSYALVGTLYLGLQLKNLYPNYSVEHIKLTMQQPWLVLWALLSIAFWVPALGKKVVFSLLHSCVFFFFLLKDLFVQFSSSSSDGNIVRNDMKIYTCSLILNLGAFGLIVLLSFLFTSYKKHSIAFH